MEQLAKMLADINAALDKTRYTPRYVRLLAVKAELEERAKPKRDISQAQLARMYGVTPRMLRYWVDRYLAEGAEGLRARGGQGRKRDVSKEDVAAAINDAIESTAGNGGGGGEDSTCAACLAEESGEGKGRQRRAPPKPCKCKGRCARPSTCACGPKKVCKCKCCRPLKHPPRGPRHDPGCTRRRIDAKGGTQASTVRDLIAARHGKKYHLHHVHKLLNENDVTYHKVSKVQTNHASAEEVQAWEDAQEGVLEPYRKKGYAIGVFDVTFIGTDGATGRVWARRGEVATLPSGGSRQVAAVHGIYFDNDRHFCREYRHADSRTLIGFLKEASAQHGKMVLYVDGSSINSSADTAAFLSEHRRLHPDRDIVLLFLPPGSPYLSVIEGFWNLMKDAVTKRHRYAEFNALRWEAMEYARTSRIRLDLYKYLYRDPKKYLQGK